jgi:hypothetical protein
VSGHTSRSAAEIYVRHLVTVLIQQWADKMVIAADIRAGACVADIAYGTEMLT